MSIVLQLGLWEESMKLAEPAGQNCSGDKGLPLHPPARDIRDLLAYRIARMAAANDRAGQIWARKKFGLRITEWRVLGLVHAIEPARFAAVADELHMDKGQLSRVIKSLMAKDLLRADADSSDQRTFQLKTTGKGHDLHERLFAFAKQRNEMIISEMSRSDVDEFSRLLHRFADNIEIAAQRARDME